MAPHVFLFALQICGPEFTRDRDAREAIERYGKRQDRCRGGDRIEGQFDARRLMDAVGRQGRTLKLRSTQGGCRGSAENQNTPYVRRHTVAERIKGLSQVQTA